MKRILAVLLMIGLLFMSMPAMAEDWVDWIDSAMTPLTGSTGAKRRNLQLAAEMLNGTAIGYGETFSFNDTVGPRSRENGYLKAPDAQGKLVLGGGMAQC